jgi:hypothetical protein
LNRRLRRSNASFNRNLPKLNHIDADDRHFGCSTQSIQVLVPVNRFHLWLVILSGMKNTIGQSRLFKDWVVVAMLWVVAVGLVAIWLVAGTHKVGSTTIDPFLLFIVIGLGPPLVFGGVVAMLRRSDVSYAIFRPTLKRDPQGISPIGSCGTDHPLND